MNPAHPLLKLKYCPKCGSRKFEKAGSRSLKCADCGFHYFINSSAAVAALVTDEHQRLMLVRRGVEPDYGKLDLPGGFVDPGETAENAVKRELLEELGLQTKECRYVCSSPNEYVFSDFCVFTLDMAFFIKPESLEDLHAMDDILEYRFYSKEEIDYNEIAATSIKQFVKRFFENEFN